MANPMNDPRISFDAFVQRLVDVFLFCRRSDEDVDKAVTEAKKRVADEREVESQRSIHSSDS